MKSIFKPYAARDERKYIQAIIIATSKLLVADNTCNMHTINLKLTYYKYTGFILLHILDLKPIRCY